MAISVAVSLLMKSNNFGDILRRLAQQRWPDIIVAAALSVRVLFQGLPPLSRAVSTWYSGASCAVSTWHFDARDIRNNAVLLLSEEFIQPLI